MKILCFFGIHALYVVKSFGYQHRCVGCRRCNSYFAMSDAVKAFVAWDSGFYEIYDWSPYEYDAAMKSEQKERKD